MRQGDSRAQKRERGAVELFNLSGPFGPFVFAGASRTRVWGHERSEFQLQFQLQLQLQRICCWEQLLCLELGE